jgi:hypothetical protein
LAAVRESAMTSEEAVGIGQDALVWLAGEPELLARFLATSGAAPGTLRARATDPELLGFVLEFVLGADATVIAFAAHAGISPGAVARARAALVGAPPAWT